MRLHVPCDVRRSICGVMVRNESSTALHNSWLVVYRPAVTLPLILLYKELSGVLRSGLRGGHSNSAGDVG
jgi:hypothetical protein